MKLPHRLMQMMSRHRVVLLAGLALLPSGTAQAASTQPSVGYACPAGGRQGTTVEVMVGGQNLRGVRNAYISGEGVHAAVTQYLPRMRREQLQELQRRIAALLKEQGAPLEGLRRGGNPGRAKPAAAGAKKQDAGEAEPVVLPDNPTLRNLDQMPPEELRAVAERFLKWRFLQPTPASIAETAVLEITIEPDAPPGDRELRLQTPLGLSNPLRFEVGDLPEALEREPNGPGAASAALDTPVVLNGDIMPQDVDRFPIRARRGQKLVISAQARRLIPYLADAVPGWFQATLALYDAGGREVAFDDDYRFDPDPVIFYQVPEDGVYTVEIRDAIYRGREDFIYRITVGEEPFITAMFPLGGRKGGPTVASVSGWNLPWGRVRLATESGACGIRQAWWRRGEWFSNEVQYAVDALPECTESEPNDTLEEAQQVALPVMVNGRIKRAGDVDVFRFRGSAGEEVVAEVYARRLGSPLDSLLRLSDSSGRVLAWNDDHPDKGAGLVTHQADSYVRARLPRDGEYSVRLSDSQQHGGEAYAYRLRIGPPRPDFALRVTPSSISAMAGRAFPISVYAMRKDGFDGEIEVALKDAPPGFALDGGRIPAGRDSARMTLSAPQDALAGPFVLHLEGRASIGGKTVTQPAAPADDMMQAFAYRHLVPAQDLMVSVSGLGRGASHVRRVGSGPVRIPAGGTAEVRVATPQGPTASAIELELSDPPGGVSLEQVTAVPGGLALVLKADGSTLQAGYADNLIVEAFTQVEIKRQGGKAATQKRRVSLGSLPAIPFQIVQR